MGSHASDRDILYIYIRNNVLILFMSNIVAVHFVFRK